MLACWEVLLKVYVWVISIVEEEQPPLLLYRKPEKSILGCLTNATLPSNVLKARL
jgi:hypothetical protein